MAETRRRLTTSLHILVSNYSVVVYINTHTHTHIYIYTHTHGEVRSII